MEGVLSFLRIWICLGPARSDVHLDDSTVSGRRGRSVQFLGCHLHLPLRGGEDTSTDGTKACSQASHAGARTGGSGDRALGTEGAATCRSAPPPDKGSSCRPPPLQGSTSMPVEGSSSASTARWAHLWAEHARAAPPTYCWDGLHEFVAAAPRPTTWKPAA